LTQVRHFDNVARTEEIGKVGAGFPTPVRSVKTVTSMSTSMPAFRMLVARVQASTFSLATLRRAARPLADRRLRDAPERCNDYPPERRLGTLPFRPDDMARRKG